jgi:hypothetical protein
MGEKRNLYRILVEKSEGKRQFGRFTHKRELDLKAARREDMDWIHVPQDRDQWWALQ